MKKIFLVDAYALIYKYYYVFLTRPMMNSAGVNTSPIFGFTKFLRDIIRKEKPHYLAVAFDSKGPTFRHEMYEKYKANRQIPPEDVHDSVSYIKDIIAASGIPILEVQGFEADDIIGTLARKASDKGYEVYMVTPDKDFGQLVRPDVFIYKQKKSGEGVEIIGPKQIEEQYGIGDPRLLADILALWGDASDNIPGVEGIGEKTASRLIGRFGTVENILENIDELSGRQKENIAASRKQLLMSKELATIREDVPVKFSPDNLVMEKPDAKALRDLFRELGFNMFLVELENGTFIPGLKAEADSGAATGKAPRHASDAGTPYEEVKPAPRTGGKKKSPCYEGQGDLFGLTAADGGSPAEAKWGESGVPETETATVYEEKLPDQGYETVDTVKHKYHIVGSAAELGSLAGMLAKSKEFCFNAETSGFDVFNDRLVGISFCIEPFEAWYVPFDESVREDYAKILRPAFEDGKIAKTGHNLKFNIMVMDAMLGIATRGVKYDTMVLHYLLDPETRHGMGYLARMYFGYSPIEMETVIGRGAKQIAMDKVPVEKAAEYSAEYADVAMRLKGVLWDIVSREKMTDLYLNIDGPMIDVLAEIETTGVKIDVKSLSEYGRKISQSLGGIEEHIRKATGASDLNVNSPRQLGEVLFEKMKIDPKPKLTKTKLYRTDEEYLSTFAGKNPVIDMILEYRGLRKLLSTYTEVLPRLVNPRTGRVHTSFNQTVTATGRLSSSNPNLQNIPIRDEAGREIRRSFVASDDDHLILSVDYSQVELRLMADLSGDKGLMEAFHKKEDIHTATAAKLFKVSIDKVTSEQRRSAKTVNFGIMYGISAFGLSQRLGISRNEGKELIDEYFRLYPGVKNYIEKVILQARKDGYVSTIHGRKRFLRNICSANDTTRGHEERNAINAPLQGSAADIIKIAMIGIHDEIHSRKLKSRVILQVHDELLVDMYKPEQEEVVDLVIGAMEGAAKLKVPLTVDYGIGSNWLEAH